MLSNPKMRVRKIPPAGPYTSRTLENLMRNEDVFVVCQCRRLAKAIVQSINQYFI